MVQRWGQAQEWEEIAKLRQSDSKKYWSDAVQGRQLQLINAQIKLDKPRAAQPLASWTRTKNSAQWQSGVASTSTSTLLAARLEPHSMRWSRMRRRP
jgi:hypothetical protein